MFLIKLFFSLFKGLAGFIVAITRILTKLVIANDRLSTFFFLLITVTYIAVSYVFHSITVQSPFVRYHTKQCAKIILRPDEDRVMVRLDNQSPSITIHI